MRPRLSVGRRIGRPAERPVGVESGTSRRCIDHRIVDPYPPQRCGVVRCMPGSSRASPTPRRRTFRPGRPPGHGPAPGDGYAAADGRRRDRPPGRESCHESRISHGRGPAARRADPVMASLAAAAGPIRLRPPQESHFARPGAGHHLSAAGRARRPRPSTAGWCCRPGRRGRAGGAGRCCPTSALRAAGLSANKAASLRDLAAKVARRHRRARPEGLAPGVRRGGHRPADRGAGHRGVDGADVPDLPAAPPRRVADR